MRNRERFNDHRCFGHKKRSGVFFGLLMFGFGTLALLDGLKLFNLHDLFHFWPVVFFIIGILKLLKARRPTAIFNGVALIGLGIALTLNEMGTIHLNWGLLWPVLFMVMGVNFFLKSIFPSDHNHKYEFDQIINNSDEFVTSEVFLGGAKIINLSQSFKGGKISATLGGVELDLRSAQITEEAQIDVQIQFGGVEIRVPNDWVIVNRATASLGAVEDKTRPPVHSEKRLIISGAVSFGAVEIKN